MSTEDQSVTPFSISVPEADLIDLQNRLQNTRLPRPSPATAWTDGVPLPKLQNLLHYWQHSYSWRKCESLLNSYPQYTSTIFGLKIHFLHIRSPHSEALPLILTHGWPGSVLEFRHVIEPLTNPSSGRVKEAFHLVIPSLPGYGFSDTPRETGWDFQKIAQAWHILMWGRLGYEKYAAQGGDWGADITAALGNQAPKGLIGVHLNTMFFDARKEILASGKSLEDLERRKNLSKEEEEALTIFVHFEEKENGYFKQQATRPQTLGYVLADSPAGQAAWVYEKLWGWSQHDREVDPFPMDEMLDNIMLYWVTNTGASSARLYWETKADTTAIRIQIPTGVSQFPGDQSWTPREWANRYYGNIVHWSDLERGGHFAAWEVPKLFVQEIRRCFAKLR